MTGRHSRPSHSVRPRRGVRILWHAHAAVTYFSWLVAGCVVLVLASLTLCLAGSV